MKQSHNKYWKESQRNKIKYRYLSAFFVSFTSNSSTTHKLVGWDGLFCVDFGRFNNWHQTQWNVVSISTHRHPLRKWKSKNNSLCHPPAPSLCPVSLLFSVTQWLTFTLLTVITPDSSPAQRRSPLKIGFCEWTRTLSALHWGCSSGWEVCNLLSRALLFSLNRCRSLPFWPSRRRRVR